MNIIIGACVIEMDLPNVRASTILTVAGRGGSKGSNLSVCDVQYPTKKSEHLGLFFY
jgi:hypothetical protein